MLNNAPSDASRPCMLIAGAVFGRHKPCLPGWFENRPALSMKAPEKSGAFPCSALHHR